MASNGKKQKEQAAITEKGNPAKPTGRFGALMLERMNESHSAVTEWGLSFLKVSDDAMLLDIGCGGGATLARLAAISKHSRVFGIDYSDVSVQKSKEHNKTLIESGRVEVLKENVAKMGFDNEAFDGIVTVESFYFWPDPVDSLKEVKRVLKNTGVFLLIADIYNTGDLPQEALENIKKYKMHNPTPEEFKNIFEAAGFSDIEIHFKNDTTWICVEGRA